jgi:RNA polymerase nonessential primary-like sigma factor
MNQTRTIRLPIHVVKELNSYLRTARLLAQELDHEPTADDIARHLNVPVEDVSKILKLNERISSIDTSATQDAEDKGLFEVLTMDGDCGPEEEVQDSDIKVSIVRWLEDLNPKQREVLARRFGLLGYEPSTLEDVGSEIGLTRERVRQIQVEALRRLKDVLGQQGLSLETIFENQDN